MAKNKAMDVIDRAKYERMNTVEGEQELLEFMREQMIFDKEAAGKAYHKFKDIEQYWIALSLDRAIAWIDDQININN